MKIIHIITGLKVGGAEMMLFKVLSKIDRSRFEPLVISLTAQVPMADKIEALGVEVKNCNMRKLDLGLSGTVRLICYIVRFKPDIVQTWMYHADLLGGIAARLLGVKYVIWNIRNSNLDKKKCNKSTLWIVKACAFLSKLVPKTIVCNSIEAIKLHQKIGYEKSKFLRISNGFDVELLRPKLTAKKVLQKQLNIDQSFQLLGMVARFDAQKNHEGFIKAAALISAKIRNVAFIMVGTHVDESNKLLVKWIDQYQMNDKIYLLGERKDIPFLMPAFDILISTSCYGEAFPNVLGEAMSCGTPCVATDVGDCSLIINDSARISPVGDMQNLAKKVWQVLLMAEEDRRLMGDKDRSRIKNHFSLSKIVKEYESLYLNWSK